MCSKALGHDCPFKKVYVCVYLLIALFRKLSFTFVVKFSEFSICCEQVCISVCELVIGLKCLTIEFVLSMGKVSTSTQYVRMVEVSGHTHLVMLIWTPDQVVAGMLLLWRGPSLVVAGMLLLGPCSLLAWWYLACYFWSICVAWW